MLRAGVNIHFQGNRHFALGFATRVNMTGFRPVSRQQQDRLRNKLFSHLSCRLFATFFPTFFAAFFADFFAAFFGPAFWHAFLSTQYKRRAILSMQYNSLLPFLGVWWGEGVCVCRSLS